MPNHCWNKIRLCAKSETIQILKEAEFSFEKLHPEPHFEPLQDLSGQDLRWYNWRIENWGCKWDRFDYKLEDEGQAALILNFTTAWGPPYKIFVYLLEKYPDLWLKCDWSEEGGMAGLFIGRTKEGKVEVQKMKWPDWCMEEWSYNFRKTNQ